MTGYSPISRSCNSKVSVYDTLLDRIDEIKTKHPSDSLPSDVLRSIFREIQISQWQNAGKAKHKDEVLDFSQGPWVLSHVCGAWRDIVISYHQLWSHIILHFPYHSIGSLGERRFPPRHGYTIDALKVVIHHSERYPLEIEFNVDPGGDEDMAVEALSVIAEESYRWRTLKLHTFLRLLERLKVVRGRIPCLESFTLNASDITQSGREDLLENTQRIFAEAPRLQKVTLRGPSGVGDLMLPLHITHLATYANNACNLGVYWSLVECHLMTRPRDDQDIRSLPLNIHLPNVRCLFVSSLRILAHLCLPSLNNLTVYHTNTHIDANTRDVQIVNDFIRRSRCSLSKLVFRSSNIDDQIFIRESLLFMDTLVFLEIMFLWIGATFDALTPVGFLPNLQHLRLFCYDIPSSQDTLIAMISSHSQNLRSVKIYCCDPEDADNISRHIAPLQKPGQHFIITHGPRDETSGLQFGKFTHSDLDAPVDQ
ncbi:uncharacterized protein EV420DRAFT_1646745 [Desarmillaria tabescens]|uniref:F-box domain-containing protein n=1 Tax=Armillaria tabescens TaxID=1929756 RepID=A0AA39JVL9_ARMTA|nr:uncharacterized protein EV420DRAFT_1646745 [Desarmillaria tabescens]KAK0449752.1 hypothetical protein EV420DRAFT_1646745 [Desarmillaria tabescens]